MAQSLKQALAEASSGAFTEEQVTDELVQRLLAIPGARSGKAPDHRTPAHMVAVAAVRAAFSDAGIKLPGVVAAELYRLIVNDGH